MKKGGFVKGGEGMIKSSGTLGIKGNKNPGEKNGKPTTATKRGNVAFKKGGEVKKYADGGPATQTGALNQMAAQQRLTPSQIARQQAMAAQAAGKPMSQAQQMAGLQQAMTASQQPGYNPNVQQQNLSGTPLGSSMQGQNILTPSQIARQQALAAQAAGQPMSQAQQMANLQGAMSGSQQMPTQTMLAGSQPMPPGVGAPMQITPQMQQQMMAQYEAVRAGQGMPGGLQQAPQQGLGQAFGGPQPMPTQQGMQQQYNPVQQSQSGQMGQALPQQSMQQQYNPFQQSQSGQMGQALPQQSMQQPQMRMGMGKFP
jgi:hypothetical protein